MQLQALRLAIYQALTRLFIVLERSVKQCFQPAKPHLIGGTLADITRSKSELIAENALYGSSRLTPKRRYRHRGSYSGWSGCIRGKWGEEAF